MRNPSALKPLTLSKYSSPPAASKSSLLLANSQNPGATSSCRPKISTCTSPNNNSSTKGNLTPPNRMNSSTSPAPSPATAPQPAASAQSSPTPPPLTQSPLSTSRRS